MSSEEQKKSSKTEDVIVASTASGLVTAAGIGLMFLGPVGIFAGGIVLGAGISGSMNTIQQGVSDSDEFSWGEYGANTAIGAATGVISGGIGAGGAALAKGLETGAQVAISIGAGAVGGSASGAAGKALTNLSEGKEVTEGIGTAVLTGALAGGIGAGAG